MKLRERERAICYHFGIFFFSRMKMMRMVVRWLMVLAVLLGLSGCGGGGSSSETTTGTVNFKDGDKVAVLDVEQADTLILDKTIDEQNSSIKILTLDSQILSDIDQKDILVIPNSKQFPLGYTAKIVGQEIDSSGAVQLKLETPSLEDFTLIQTPKIDTKVSQLDLVGVISPSQSYKTDSKLQKTIAHSNHKCNFTSITRLIP